MKVKQIFLSAKNILEILTSNTYIYGNWEISVSMRCQLPATGRLLDVCVHACTMSCQVQAIHWLKLVLACVAGVRETYS